MTKSRTLFVVAGGLPFIIYLSTLAPSITWRNGGADSGDFATAVAVGGVPHPPGYPTYLLLGEVFSIIPLGDIAYRLNFLSATCAALAVAFLGITIFQTLLTADQREAEVTETDRRSLWLCALAAAWALAFSATYWSQATIAEVYSLNALFAAALLYGANQVKLENQKWGMPILGAVMGLSLGNHFSIILVFPMVIWLVRVKWQWRLIVATLVAFGLGLSVYLIIPLRAANSPPVNWGMANNWTNFWWLVSGRLYRQFLFTLPWSYVLTRVLAELRLLANGFMWWGLSIGYLGLERLFRLNRALTVSSLFTFFFISMYTIGYDTTDSYVYLLPAFIIFALWVGWGFHNASLTLQKFINTKGYSVYIGNWLFLLLPLLSLGINFSSQNISRDNEAYIYAQEALDSVRPGAIIIADNDLHTFALWYGRYGYNWRSDVAIINSHLLYFDWYRRILQQNHDELLLVDQHGQPLTTSTAVVESNISHSPIYLATLLKEPPEFEEYDLETFGNLKRVVKK